MFIAKSKPKPCKEMILQAGKRFAVQEAQLHRQELVLPAQRGDQEVWDVPASHLEHFND